MPHNHELRELSDLRDSSEDRMLRRAAAAGQAINWIKAIIFAIIIGTGTFVALYKDLKADIKSLEEKQTRYRTTQKTVYKQVFGQELPE